MGSKRLTAKTVAKIGPKIDMANVQNLRRRGRIFYYQRAIPEDVRGLYDGKAQLWINLRTSDFHQAKQLCLQYTLEHDRLVRDFRQRHIQPPLDLTDHYLDDLASTWASSWLREDEQQRLSGKVNPQEIRLLDISHSPESLKKLISLESRANWDGITPLVVRDFLKRQGIDLAPDNERFKYLCARFRVEAWSALEILQQRTQGVPVASPPAKVVKKPTAKVYLHDLLEPWKVRQQPKASSILEFERSVTRFNEKFPTLAVPDIETIHVVEYRDHLSSAGLAAATVVKHLNGIKALLGIAVERGLIKFNPAARVKPPKASGGAGDSRQPFTVDQLNQLFSSAIYSGSRIPAAGKGVIAQWLPLLGLFTGARVEELCQLRSEDIQEEEGIPFLFIRRKHPEQDIKTASSMRRVPVHPTLIDFGFLQYVKMQSDRGAQWLFGELVADVKGNRSGNWSKWFHRYLREEVGIKDNALVFHSLRHTFKAECRRCLIAEDVHDALTGHVNGSVGRSYGGSLYPLRPLWEAIKVYHIHGLKLPARFFDADSGKFASKPGK